MDVLCQRSLDFVVLNFPPWRALLLGGPVSLLWAGACMAMEAVSPHGWDDAVLQIGHSWMAAVFMAGGVG